MRILLGISGGIAAVKTPEVVRRLREQSHEVRCALTPNGERFVSPLALEVLSGHPVYREEYLRPDVGGDELHISVARWADVICIVPATCNTLARIALGLADDFLSTTVLAYSGSIVLAPAMSSEMWSKPIVQVHVAALEDRGALRIGPVSGSLADGSHGIGRMAEPEQIVAAITGLAGERDLTGRTVLITAGPTREPIDPVRYLSNRSSGKMGYSLAAEAASRGAKTLLISGPVNLQTPADVARINVETAVEMKQRVDSLAPEADVIIMAAAVADFKPKRVVDQKIKKARGVPGLELEENPDILSHLRKLSPEAILVGFAAETQNLEAEAGRKLREKDVDFIVANDVSRPGSGFDAETNEVVVLSAEGASHHLTLKPKRVLAGELLDIFAKTLRDRESRVVARD